VHRRRGRDQDDAEGLPRRRGGHPDVPAPDGPRIVGIDGEYPGDDPRHGEGAPHRVLVRVRSAAEPVTSVQRVLFHRNYQTFSGGHLKVWDYFQHVAHADGFAPEIYFDPASVWDDTNPWRTELARVRREWSPADADVLFLAGMDWDALPR